HLQDGLAPGQVGQLHRHPPVEPDGPRQGGVQALGAVGGRQDDDAVVALEAVHLGQQLVEVYSRSSLPPMRLPMLRFWPMASISSINTMQGAFSLACLNRSRTLEAPMPTNISTNSEPDIEKKGTPASPATALASMVLPVPGGPTSKTPLGIEAPTSVYFLGLWR